MDRWDAEKIKMILPLARISSLSRQDSDQVLDVAELKPDYPEAGPLRIAWQDGRV